MARQESWRWSRVDRTCAVITSEPNELAAPIHDRMPISTRGKNDERGLLARVHSWRTYAPGRS
jgi:putative SOS response-associated peptidase YedK